MAKSLNRNRSYLAGPRRRTPESARTPALGAERLEDRCVLATVAMPSSVWPDPLPLESFQQSSHIDLGLAPDAPTDFVFNTDRVADRMQRCSFQVELLDASDTATDISVVSTELLWQMGQPRGYYNDQLTPMEMWVVGIEPQFGSCPTLQLTSSLEVNLPIRVTATVQVEAAQPRIPLLRMASADTPEDAEPQEIVEDSFQGGMATFWSDKFSAPELALDWQVHVQGAGTVTLGEGIEGPSMLLTATESDPSGPVLEWAVSLIYDSETGSLRVRSERLPFTTLEIRSPSGIFRGPRPNIIGGSPFDVFYSRLFFVLQPQGISEMDLGPVLPPHLDLAELESEFVLAGSNAGGGPLGPVRYFSEQTFEQAMGAAEGRTGASLIDAVLTLEAPEDLIEIRFDYRVLRDPDRPSSTTFDETPLQSGLQYSTNQGRSWRNLASWNDCGETVCHVRETVINDSPSAEPFESLRFRFRNASASDTVAIDNLQLRRFDPLASHLYAFSLPDDEFAAFSVRNVRFEGLPFDTRLSVNLYDDQLQLIAQYRDHGVEPVTGGFSGKLQPGPVDRFFLEIRGNADYVAEVYEDSLPGDLVPDRLAEALPPTWLRIVYKGVDSITWQPSEPVDQRSCRPEYFQWDGPAVTQVEWAPLGGNFQTRLAEPIATGEYLMHVRQGACQSLLGMPVQQADYPIDSIPPDLADTSIRPGMTLPTGHHDMVLTFAEVILAFQGAYRLERADGTHFWSPPPDSLLNSLRFAKNVVLPLGDLPTGEYRFVIEDGNVVDLGLNATRLDPLVIEFQILPEGWGPAWDALDVNRDGVVDQADGQVLREALSAKGTHPAFDFNQDGVFNRRDLNAIVQRGVSYPVGDVNLDGVFDHRDIRILGDRGYGAADGWVEGDFNGDGVFDSRDLVLALAAGTFVSDGMDDLEFQLRHLFFSDTPDLDVQTLLRERRR